VLELEPEWPAALDGNRWFLIAQGDLAVVRGRLPDAGRDFVQAKGLAERLIGLEPDNRDWQRNIGLCLERIGDTKAAQGDLAGALADYGQSLATAERLAAADPSNADWQRDLAVSHYKLGGIADRQGREDLLRQHWGEMLAIFAAMQQRGLHVSPEDLAGLEAIRARVQGAAR
jgi:tetratricopeptide (TPR) repeat protein